MRLIDADVFKTEYENLITWVSHRAEKARLREFIKDIQNQPTIDAIPIEWIKGYTDSTLDDGNSQMLGFKAAIIKEMVEEWDKENEMR